MFKVPNLDQIMFLCCKYELNKVPMLYLNFLRINSDKKEQIRFGLDSFVI
jgi:hypothetical protein